MTRVSSDFRSTFLAVDGRWLSRCLAVRWHASALLRRLQVGSTIRARSGARQSLQMKEWIALSQLAPPTMAACDGAKAYASRQVARERTTSECAPKAR